MKVSEVPQDRNPRLGGAVRKLMYATNEAGEYVTVPSDGWVAEEVVTSDAMDEFQRLTEASRARVEAGLSSPLEFHMHRVRMDLDTLAQCAGLWRWRVRRHLRPGPFAGLSASLRARYARVMGMAVDELGRLPPLDPDTSRA